MKPLVALTGCLSLGLVSCQTLEHDAWSQIGKGSNEIVASSGWSVYQARVTLDGPSPALDGAATTDLEPNFGAGLRYSRFLTDSWSLGVLIEYRSFDADPVSPISAELDADDYESTHIILANRFYGNTFGEDDRWRVLAGIDLGYIPKVELDATVDYGMGATEEISVEGDSYITVGGLLGLSYLLNDSMAVSFGAFYEHPLDSSDDTATLTIPGIGIVDIDAEVDPAGWIGFLSLSYYF